MREDKTPPFILLSMFASPQLTRGAVDSGFNLLLLLFSSFSFPPLPEAFSALFRPCRGVLDEAASVPYSRFLGQNPSWAAPDILSMPLGAVPQTPTTVLPGPERGLAVPS